MCIQQSNQIFNACLYSRLVSTRIGGFLAGFYQLPLVHMLFNIIDPSKENRSFIVTVFDGPVCQVHFVDVSTQ